jgi:hypothetical protein
MTNGRHWHFYAQLDLEAVAGLQSWLPRTGRLYFFAEGQDASDRTLVMHDTSPRASLQPYEWSHDARFVDGDNVPEAYAAYRATVDATVSAPHRYTGDDAGLMEIWDDDEQNRAYTALETELAGSDDLQHGVHLQNAFVFAGESGGTGDGHPGRAARRVGDPADAVLRPASRLQLMGCRRAHLYHPPQRLGPVRLLPGPWASLESS